MSSDNVQTLSNTHLSEDEGDAILFVGPRYKLSSCLIRALERELPVTQILYMQDVDRVVGSELDNWPNVRLLLIDESLGQSIHQHH